MERCSGATTKASTRAWAKLDAATGTVLWDLGVAHAPCANLCFENSPTVLPGGDLLIHGRLGSRALLRRFHNDGSGTVDEWLVGADAPSQQACRPRTATRDGSTPTRCARGFPLATHTISLAAHSASAFAAVVVSHA